jgi:plasmid stability protein
MGMITVRDVDDSLLRALEQRATAAGRSVEEEVRDILARTVQPATPVGKEDFWERADRLRASFANRVVTDSAELLREVRDERTAHLGEP